ncbi:redoxin domain-containing protein [Alkalibacter sp. M17DMB]|nr:redoxin domain-containing protein [Alkalibacter mobilis]
MSHIAVSYDKLQELNVEVLSVSTDSVFSHKIWNETELSKMAGKDMPFPMVSDQTGAIGKLYGVYDEDAGQNVRGRFLIDPDGIIQAAEILSPPVGRNPKELVRQIKAYQHHQKTGEVMPSGWEEGGSTLKPSTDLAGNVWKVWQPPKE